MPRHLCTRTEPSGGQVAGVRRFFAPGLVDARYWMRDTGGDTREGWLHRMGFLRRRRDKPGTLRTAESADTRYLREWVQTRRGIEGYVEPRTAVSDTTLLLVAIDGEWTRRRVPSVEWAHEFANKEGIPSYDAAVVGYPARMREWNRRQSRESKGK
ncbi:MAG: hypothetical protein ACRDQA_10510 [Nocardioidaceae bacterium]